MPKRPLIVAANRSPATRISFKTALHLNNWFRERGVEPICLFGPKARRNFLGRALKQLKANEEPPHLVIFISHGEDNLIVGQETGILRVVKTFPRLALVAQGQNDHWFKDCIVVALCCDTLEELGPSVIENGAVAYLGSNRKMLVDLTDLDSSESLDVVDVFSESVKCLAEGNSVRVATQEHKEEAKYFLDLCINQGFCEARGLGGEYIYGMNMNSRFFDYIGDGNATWANVVPEESRGLGHRTDRPMLY